MNVFKTLLRRTIKARTAAEVHEVYEDMLDEWLLTDEETEMLFYFLDLKYREVAK